MSSTRFEVSSSSSWQVRIDGVEDGFGDSRDFVTMRKRLVARKALVVTMMLVVLESWSIVFLDQ